MTRLQIRAAGSADLGALTTVWARSAALFDDRLARQDAGRGELLCAWSGGLPIAHVYLWLDAAEEPELREHLPDVPLLMHLRVVPTWRKRGTATRLITAAERRLRTHGYARVALGVERSNLDAIALYHRVGYEDWGRGDVTCSARDWSAPSRPPASEVCHILLKRLGGAS